MNEAQLKAKLERAVRQEIMGATWQRLKESGWITGYLEGKEAWDDLKHQVKEDLRYQDDLLCELAGTPAKEQGGQTPGTEDIDDFANASQPVPMKWLSRRTKARARALSERYALLAGEPDAYPLIEPLKVKIERRDVGTEEDPGLMLVLEIDVWVPPEEVARAYRTVRSQILDEEGGRTDEGTLEVARFVWNEERKNGGKRPSWALLLERWKRDHPDETRFRSYSNFRQYFIRGRNAAIPLYKNVLFPLPPEQRAEAEALNERLTSALQAYAKRTDNRFHFE